MFEKKTRLQKLSSKKRIVELYKKGKITREECLDCIAVDYGMYVSAWAGYMGPKGIISEEITKENMAEVVQRRKEEIEDIFIKKETTSLDLYCIKMSFGTLEHIKDWMTFERKLYWGIGAAAIKQLIELDIDPKDTKTVIEFFHRCLSAEVKEVVHNKNLPHDYDLTMAAYCFPIAVRAYDRLKAVEAGTYVESDFYNENGWPLHKEGKLIHPDPAVIYKENVIDKIDFKGLDKIDSGYESNENFGADALTNMLKDYAAGSIGTISLDELNLDS